MFYLIMGIGGKLSIKHPKSNKKTSGLRKLSHNTSGGIGQHPVSHRAKFQYREPSTKTNLIPDANPDYEYQQRQKKDKFIQGQLYGSLTRNNETFPVLITGGKARRLKSMPTTKAQKFDIMNHFMDFDGAIQRRSYVTGRRYTKGTKNIFGEQVRPKSTNNFKRGLTIPEINGDVKRNKSYMVTDDIFSLF